MADDHSFTPQYRSPRRSRLPCPNPSDLTSSQPRSYSEAGQNSRGRKADLASSGSVSDWLAGGHMRAATLGAPLPRTPRPTSVLTQSTLRAASMASTPETGHFPVSFCNLSLKFSQYFNNNVAKEYKEHTT